MAKKQFKAESKRLLDLMINSIYTHKEIFLRELISNASDAIDKLYLTMAQNNTGVSRDDFEIRIDIDKDNRRLIISDNGIGMTKEQIESWSHCKKRLSGFQKGKRKEGRHRHNRTVWSRVLFRVYGQQQGDRNQQSIRAGDGISMGIFRL